MTREQKATWIRNGVVLLLAIAIPIVVFAPSKPKPKEQDKKEAPQTVKPPADEGSGEITHFHAKGSLQPRQIAKILDEASRLRGGLVIGIIHCHLPGNAESEEMADILNRVARKYGKQVRVFRVDINANPDIVQTEKVTSPPKVVMMVGAERACKFQGLWTQAQVERKVDELLHGLERMGKNWRPDVKGMSPAASSKTAPPPAK